MLRHYNHTNSVPIAQASSLCSDSTIIRIRYLSHRQAAYAQTVQSYEFGTYRTGKQLMLRQYNHTNSVPIAQASSLCSDSTIIRIRYLSHRQAAYAQTVQSYEFGTYRTGKQLMLRQYNHTNSVPIAQASSLCSDSTIIRIRYLSHRQAAYAQTIKQMYVIIQESGFLS